VHVLSQLSQRHALCMPSVYTTPSHGEERDFSILLEERSTSKALYCSHESSGANRSNGNTAHLLQKGALPR
jgi:hypothetical protein